MMVKGDLSSDDFPLACSGPSNRRVHVLLLKSIRSIVLFQQHTHAQKERLCIQNGGVGFLFLF